MVRCHLCAFADLEKSVDFYNAGMISFKRWEKIWF